MQIFYTYNIIINLKAKTSNKIKVNLYKKMTFLYFYFVFNKQNIN
jgi:hypothetical protein